MSIWPAHDDESKRLSAILLALLFAIELGIRYYIHFSKLQDDWYYGRAVAESIKTMTWKFAMRPAKKESQNSHEEQFNQQIFNVLKIWEGLRPNLKESDAENFVSQNLAEVKSKVDWQKKREYYRRGRILNQQKWYKERAAKNKELGKQYFALTILCYALAMVLSILYINNLDHWNFVPLITVIASAMISWTQLNHFRDLNNAYTVARIEIEEILKQMANATEDDFYELVEDAENAFSREHTLWMARKDADILAKRMK